jgi:hypothetical protein
LRQWNARQAIHAMQGSASQVQQQHALRQTVAMTFIPGVLLRLHQEHQLIRAQVKYLQSIIAMEAFTYVIKSSAHWAISAVMAPALGNALTAKP